MKPTSDQIAKLPKWAQKYVTDLESEVARLSCLPDAPVIPEPDLPPPDYNASVDMNRGWDIHLYHLKDSLWGIGSAVSKACSSSMNHGSGWDRTTSQRPVHLYSTERKAWVAARATFIQWAGQQLAKIDALLAKSSDEKAP